MIIETSYNPVIDPRFPPGVFRLEYRSDADNTTDWAMVMPGQRDVWVVHLHGATSNGDQIFVRKDIRDLWLPHDLQHGCGVLGPNLRNDAWMCPEAVDDLHALLDWVRQRYRAKRFVFMSGSMGGTGNLIYGIRHPEDVSAMVALCPVTDILTFYNETSHTWKTLEIAYHGTPDQVPQRYQDHRVVQHADRLKMPLFLSHGDADAVIPVKHSRELYQLLKNQGNTEYLEIPGGDHDAPLFEQKMLDWFDHQLDI